MQKCVQKVYKIRYAISVTMALQQWIHIPRHNIHNIPWKTFVRESSNTQNESPAIRVHQLAFQGNEAKAAYEEVIQQTSSATTVRLRCLKSKSVATQSNSGTNLTSVNAQSKRTTVSDDVLAKVTINTLLKAVEQKDLKFLQKYMTSDNVNLSDDFGWTPLMSAAYCGHLEIVQFLLSLGANKKIRDRSGLTAAQLALKRNYLSIVALLKKKSESLSNNNQSSANVSRTCTTGVLPVKSISAESPMECRKGVFNLTEEKASLPQSTTFYCEICKATFQETTLQKHESSTLHIFNTKPKLKHTMYGISKQSKGYRMLLNTGWDEENGLGPSGKGMKYPIKTCVKTDRKGLGQSTEGEYKITHLKSSDTMNEQQTILEHLETVEHKANEILTDQQEIIALDKRRNDDRVGMRALQKQSYDKTWITVGPLILKMPSKTAEELLEQDQRECSTAINKLRSDMKVKVNELRELELTPPVPGLMLEPLSIKEMDAVRQVVGRIV